VKINLTLEEARQICEDWLAFIERQKTHAKMMQEAARLAKAGKQHEANQLKMKVDAAKMVVYDGGRLEPAVRTILTHLAGRETG
jgi:hypothetical protein